MIQISPQPQTAEVPGAEYLRKPEPSPSAEGAEKRDGVFAKILAGLLGKTGIREAESSGDAGLALNAEESLFPSPRNINEEDPSAAGPGGAKKSLRTYLGNVRQGRGPEADSPKEAGALRGLPDRLLSGKNGKTGADSPEEEILFGPGYLLRPFAEKTVPAGEAEEGAAVFAEKPDAETAGAAENISPGEEAAGWFSGPPGTGLSGTGLPGAFYPEGGAEAAEASASEEIRGEGVKGGSKRAFRGAVEEFSGTERLSEAEDRRISPKKPDGPGLERNGGRLEEARREKRRGSLDVRDLRGAEARAEDAKSAGEPLKEENAAPGAGETRELTVELRSAVQRRDAPSQAETGWETRSGRAFEDLLARELHQNLNSDIVRHASVLLRDGGEGTIRLSLKPESLGNVKIRLEMAENKITGYIVVESEEALRAFEREIHSLEQTFRDSGFQGADLEMSLAADGRGLDQQGRGEEAGPFLSGPKAVSRYEAGERAGPADIGAPGVYQPGRNFINVLA